MQVGTVLDLKLLQNVTPGLQNTLLGSNHPPFSFIKSWEKHLWRPLCRPILLLLEQSHCLSTASFDVPSHFPQSGSRAAVCSQLHSLPLEKQLSSLCCVLEGMRKMCRVFFFFYCKCPVVCVKMGKTCLVAEMCYQSLSQELIFWYFLLFDERNWKYNRKASRPHPLYPKVCH